MAHAWFVPQLGQEWNGRDEMAQGSDARAQGAYTGLPIGRGVRQPVLKCRTLACNGPQARAGSVTLWRTERVGQLGLQDRNGQ